MLHAENHPTDNGGVAVQLPRGLPNDGVQLRTNRG
jgi:hypothetical protein